MSFSIPEFQLFFGCSPLSMRIYFLFHLSLGFMAFGISFPSLEDGNSLDNCDWIG